MDPIKHFYYFCDLARLARCGYAFYPKLWRNVRVQSSLVDYPNFNGTGGMVAERWLT